MIDLEFSRQQQQANQKSELLADMQLRKSSIPLLKLNATKEGSYDVRLTDDNSDWWISGLAITKDGKVIMVDYNNEKVKLFSQGREFLSSVSVPDRPLDIAVVREDKAVVSASNKSLVILVIDGKQLRIDRRIQLSYDVRGVARFKDKLAVTSSRSVRLIDLSGKVYWSVSSDQQGQPLFLRPVYVSSQYDEKMSNVIVTDDDNHTLTMLDGDTGEIITSCTVKGKRPRGVTTDRAGNVYVCYWDTNEVSVMTADLSQERTLLTEEDGRDPWAIVYDDATHGLVVSYGCGIVDQFTVKVLADMEKTAV